MQRIHLPNTRFLDVLEISEKQLYHQLTRVLRARVWQEVVFFDGISREDHLYSMIHIDKNSVSFKKTRVTSKNSELSSELTLYQAFPNKLSKFETIMQKCSEVWYRAIIFFESERTQKLVISDNKKERLTRIAIEAIELCGGNIIPEIEYRPELWDIRKGSSIICHTQWEEALSLSEITNFENLNVIVWPEGWFSPEEISSIEAQKVYFWDRILRCETVGEVVWFYLSQTK
jgi:RsmE family RNA methyltransferase